MSSEMIYEPNVFIPLPNGMQLAARIWKPADVAEHPAPAVLEFLPYRRRDMTAPRDELTYPQFAARGIVGVRVDMRGTGESDGLFDDEYSEQELSDAEAVIAWIADQPWCNGRVGMMGISWGGFNGLQVAARRPPALGAVISIASTVDRFADDIHFKGGAMLSSNLYWANQMLCYNARVPDSAVREDWRELWLERLKATAPVVEPWFAHGRRDAYWKHGSICDNFDDVTIPTFVIAGWADGYRNTPWKARMGMPDRCHAMTGPWIHKYPHFAKPGPQFEFIDAACAFWHEHLSGRGEAGLAGNRVYMLHGIDPSGDRSRDAGRWLDIDDRAAQDQVLYLTPTALSPAPNAVGGEAVLRSPLVMALEGGEYFCGSIDEGLAADQARTDGASLCFDTGALDAPMEMIGMATLGADVAIDAPQGYVIARLMDVHPDGRSTLISKAILNLSHRNGPEVPQPMTPHKAERVTLTFDAAAYHVPAGHQLRLALSTNYFPFIMPAPTDVTAKIDLSDAQLHLPIYPYTEVAVPEGAHRLPDYETREEGHTRRDVTEVDGITTVRLETDTGHLIHPEHGIEWRDTRSSTWSIQEGDPLSVVGEEENHDWHWRDGVETHVVAKSRLTTDGGHWKVETSLHAYEQDQEVYARQWQYTKPRDHM